jgi:hypothetical protein
MSDYLTDCNAGEFRIDPKTFRQTWCVRCSRSECSLAEFVTNDPMAIRQATWQDRFFDPAQADLAIPKFALIAKLDFPDLLQKAMKLEVSERRGDWSVPEINIADGRIVSASPDVTNQVDEAVRQLSQSGRPPEDDYDDPALDEYDDPALDEPVAEPAAEVELLPVHSGKPLVARPMRINTPDPGEVMIGGGPNPVQRAKPQPETDPWAAPSKPKHKVVKLGATIQFGTDGGTKVVE